MTWNVHCDYNHAKRGWDFYLWQDRPASGKQAALAPLVFVEVEPGACVAPALSLPRDGGPQLMQAMLDEAWRMGLRPSGDSVDNRERELKAVVAHLDDMRRLVFREPAGDV